jgi:HD-GYP domain-containing protein (c-di-GMP phosphodiesterase class II)/CHASE2 domain-containing sensor protein
VSAAARHKAAVLLTGAAAIIVTLALHLGGALGGLEDAAVDARFSLRGAQPTDEIAVVAIDEDTFAELEGATWPLKRTYHANVVDRLAAAGVREIVYDVQFTEPSPYPKADLALFEALDAAGGAVLATAESDAEGRTEVLGGDENLATIGAVAAAANMPAGRGGVIRHYDRVVGRLETLATVTAGRLGARIGPADFDGAGAWIDFRGGPGTFPTYSFSDVHDGRVDPAALRGKVVVVGASALTLQDLHPTSTTGEEMMSGAEIQANAISTALRGNPLRSAPAWLPVVLVALLGLLAPLLILWLRPLAWALAVPLLAGLHLIAAYGAFMAGWITPVVAPLGALLLSALGVFAAAFVAEVTERRRMRHYSERLEREVRERTRELRETQLEAVERLALAAESRDGATGEHIERMSRMAERIALAAGMSGADAETLRHAAALHDVGKIGVPDSVLLKPGKLDPAEWKIMQEHTTGARAVLGGSRSPILRLAETIALTHHEKWDGSGYPAGLRGEEIPLAGRICAIADVYDALTSERPYKRAWSPEEALSEIRDQAGRHFDPSLVDVFLGVVGHEPDGVSRPPVPWTAVTGSAEAPASPRTTRSGALPRR